MNVDQQHKLIQRYSVIHAAIHDSQVFEELLDQTRETNSNKRAVYTNSAYRSQTQK